MRYLKFVFAISLIFVMLFSLSFPSLADDSIYVWSSTSNSINETSNNISNSSVNNSTSNNTSSNTNSSNMSGYNTSNITTNSTNSISNSIETNVSTDTDDNNSLNLESESAILIEQKTGQILYSHNIHEQLRPASVTKVMSILLIMESLANGKISLTDQVPCSENAASMGGSQIWLDPRETLTVDEMLKAICVASANDCVVAMAEYIAGSEESFVQMMNDKAKKLGMNDTTFKKLSWFR